MFASNNGYNKAKKIVDDWLGQPVVTSKVASELTSEPAQQVEQFAGSGSTTNMDSVLDEILGDIAVPTPRTQEGEATLNNLFTDTLLKEYASMGEKGKELINLLYLNPNWMDQDNFKKLNTLVYNLVMQLFEGPISRTSSIRVKNGKEYSLGLLEATNADFTCSGPSGSYFSYYLEERLDKGDCYKLVVAEPDSKTVYAGENSSPYITNTAAISELTTEATNMFQKYNNIVEDASMKMDAEVLTQLSEIITSDESMGIENLYKEASTWYEITWDSAAKLQKGLFVYGIVSMGSCGSICDTSYIRKYSTNAYQFRIKDTDMQNIIRTEPIVRYRNGGKTKEIIDRYFHEETAIEDLFRLLGYGCSSYQQTEFILGKQPLMNALEAKKFFSSDSGYKNRIIEKLLKALVIPMVPAKFGNVNVSRLAKKIKVEPFEAEITTAYGKFQYREVLSKVIPALFMTAWSEYMIMDLSEEAAKGFISFIQSHEIYKALMRHAEEEDLTGLKEEIKEPFVRNDVQTKGFEFDFGLLYKEMGELFVDLAHFTAAAQIVAGIMMHKIVGAIKPDVIFGLSSSLIHVTRRVDNMVLTLPIKATIHNDNTHVEGFFAKCKKEVPKMVKLLNPDNNKTILVLQDTPSGLLTTGAPVIHAFPIDIIDSQEKLYNQRESLKESFYIVANTETYSSREVSALLSENRWKASLDRTDESFRRTLAKRIAQPTWESSLRVKQYTAASYMYNHAEMFPSLVYNNTPGDYEAAKDSKMFNPYGVSLVIRGPSNNSTDSNFYPSDNRYDLPGFKSSCSDDLTPEWWAYASTKNNPNHSVEVIDASIILGNGTAAFLDNHMLFPKVIRTGSFMRKVFSGKNREKAFSENARIFGSLVVPEFVHVDQPKPLPQRISRVNSPFARGNTKPLYAQNLRYITDDFGLEDVIASANILENEAQRIITLDEDGIEPEPFTRVPLVKIDWLGMCRYRDNDRENYPGLSTLNRLRRIRTTNYEEDNTITLAEFNYKYLCGASRGIVLNAFSRDIHQGITLYEPLVSYFLVNLKLADAVKPLVPLKSFIKSEKKVTHDLTKPTKVLPEEEARASDMNVSLGLQLEDQNRPVFLPAGARGSAGLKLAKEYNDSIKSNFRKDKLDPAKKELEKRQTEVARLQSMLRQEQHRVQELQMELEELEKRGIEAGLNRPDSLQNRLRRLILKGYILDYAMDDTGWLKLIVKAPNIWVGGLIYTFSPAIVKVPLSASAMSAFPGSGNNRLRAYALKDLLNMRLEAYKDFGSKYGVTSFSQLFRGESLLMTRESNAVGFFNSSGVLDYPHVRSGSGCLGDLISRFQQDVREGDLANIITSVLYYLNSVNILDGWGKGIRYWPAIPATMFNLLKCGLLTDMDEHRQQYIVIPGKSLIAGKNCPNVWYQKWNVKEFPMAMIDVRDMNPEILYYLYQEASTIQENGYDHDYDYMASYGKTKFSLTVLGAECPYFSKINSKPNILYDTPIGDPMLTEALKFVSVMKDYAYNSYTPGTAAEQDRDWKFLEHSIENIETWRSSIRKISSIEDGTSGLEIRNGITCTIELKDDKVIIGGN